VSADKTPQVQTRAIGLEQDREQHQRDERKKRLDLEVGVAAQIRDHFGEHSDHEQVNPCQQHGERSLED